MFNFGPDDALVASITEPKSSSAEIGAIVWGMDIAGLRNARALAALGFTVMQVHQRRRQVLADVQRCKAAMDALAARRNVEKFILKGSCGRASLCFNTALEDHRVVGIILANPNVSEVLTVSDSYKRKFFSPNTWKRIFTGQINIRRHIANAHWFAQSVLGRLKREDEKFLVERFTGGSAYKKDRTLPDNIDEKLKILIERNVNILIIFSKNDDSLLYFEKKFGRSFERLGSSTRLSLEVVPIEGHSIWKDDAAASVMTPPYDSQTAWTGGRSSVSMKAMRSDACCAAR
jgi:hypothetical protein